MNEKTWYLTILILSLLLYTVDKDMASVISMRLPIEGN